MAEARITVTFTPAEYDLVREALDAEQKRATGAADDRHTDMKTRLAERTLAARLADVLAKLR